MVKVFAMIIGMTMMAVCESKQSPKEVIEEPKELMTKEKSLLLQTIIAHGGDRYDEAHYQFVFRGKLYTFHNQPDNYEYTVKHNKDRSEIIDDLNNGQLTRTINEVVQELSEKDRNRYAASLNSVIYFATLPHKLSDPAVNLDIVGETTIREKEYDILQVTFDQEGGGKDHDDQFHYWINKSDHTIDYLAYNYKTNNGGVRFRSAYNRRTVDGIIFQDYVNYKADVGTPLADLPTLYEQEELKELSRIETEDVRVLR